jgi:hypothetical protein
MHTDSNSCTVWTDFVVIYLFYCCHPHGIKVIFHCGLIYISLIANDTEHFKSFFFLAFIYYLEECLDILCPFLNCNIFLFIVAL